MARAAALDAQLAPLEGQRQDELKRNRDDLEREFAERRAELDRRRAELERESIKQDEPVEDDGYVFQQNWRRRAHWIDFIDSETLEAMFRRMPRSQIAARYSSCRNWVVEPREGN